MGRRRRRVIKVMKKKLPKVFSCPQCGMVSVKVSVDSIGNAKIVCGSCNLTWSEATQKKTETIDVYNRFVDEFIKGRVKV